MRLLPKRPIPEAGRRPSQTAKGRGVFSYYANRSTDTAPTGRAGQKPLRTAKPRWHYIPSMLAALALIISLGYILRLDTNPKISLAGSTNGLSLRTTNTYQQAARSVLNRSWFNRNKLTVDTGSVERQLKQQFPELEDIAVTLPLLGHRPVIRIAVVQPAILLVSNGNLAVIAGNGQAVASGPSLNGAALKTLPRVQDDSGLRVQVGGSALPAAQVSFIQGLVAQLNAQKISVQSLTLPAAANQVDVRLQGQPYFLKFNTTLDARQQVGAFLATKQKLDSEHITPAEYIDFRVEEKVFYK